MAATLLDSGEHGKRDMETFLLDCHVGPDDSDVDALWHCKKQEKIKCCKVTLQNSATLLLFQSSGAVMEAPQGLT